MGDIGPCSKCGRPDAGINTPAVDAAGNVFCGYCASGSPTLAKGIDQYRDADGRFKKPALGGVAAVYMKEGCILWVYENGSACAWTDNGRCDRFLRPEDKALAHSNPEALLDEILAMRQAGRYRCSKCGTELPEAEVERGAWATKLCPEHFAAWQAKVDADRKAGRVCPRCRQPYDLCCC